MSPHSYEVIAIREALEASAPPTLLTEEQIAKMAEDVVTSLRGQHLRLTDDGTTPSIDG